MTTRSELRKYIREVLYDNIQWPESSLNNWINDAIRDFSNYFSRAVATDINCVADQYIYSFSSYDGLREVLGVEYPKGENPPRWLSRLSEKSPNFRDGPYYDLVGGAPPGAMELGEAPKTGEQITLDYLADHTIPSTDMSSITVEERHWQALYLFVQWQAIRELEMDEARQPDDSNIVLSMLGLNSGRAERLYRSKLREYKSTEADGGAAGPWVMDSNDRIY
jgi:hypothetical protein